MSGTQAQAVEESGGAPPPDRAEIEARAARMGWQPREKFRGRGEWVDAPEYVERGERILPLLQERNRVLDRTVADLQKQMSDNTSTLVNLVATTRQAERVGYQRAMRELRAKRDEAIDAGDKAAVHRVEQEIAEMGPEPAAVAPPKPTAPTVDASVADFARRNPWFNTHRGAKGYAIATLDDVQAENPSWSLTEQLDEVEDRVRQRFPELFPRQQRQQPRQQQADAEEDLGEEEPPPPPRQRRPAMVTPSNQAPQRQVQPRSFDAMPAEAKREWQRQAKMMEGKGEPFSKEEYARYYWEAETGEAA